jgi:hypothetical protein
MNAETLGNDRESLPAGQVPVREAAHRSSERKRSESGRRLDRDPPEIYPNASWNLKPETEARLRERLSRERKSSSEGGG